VREAELCGEERSCEEEGGLPSVGGIFHGRATMGLTPGHPITEKNSICTLDVCRRFHSLVQTYR